MPPDTVPGRCFCGAVRFVVEMPTGVCVHCHCSMCRQMHGAAYVTWFELPKSQLKIEAGDDSLRSFDSSDRGKRSFCTSCGSALFCEISSRPGQIDVVLANLEGPIDRAPQMHIFFSDRASWTVVEDDLPKLGGKTGMEPLA